MNSIAVTLLTLMATSSNAMMPAICRWICPPPPPVRRRLPSFSFIFKTWEFIGGGGFGSVYRVGTGTVNEDAVIKVFDQPAGYQRLHIKLCEYETAILKKIASYEARPKGKTLQISHIRTDFPTVLPTQLMLEYIPGKDLRHSDFTKYCDSMPKFVDIIMSMMQQISGVFEGLHSAYIYHNDVKHDNILFVPGTESFDPKFYLIDFGLAFSLSNINVEAFEQQIRQSLSPWCSLKFMSPYHLELMDETRLAQARRPTKMSGDEMREAAKKADRYSLALTAIDSIKRHCDRNSVDDKDPLCKMAQGLVKLQKNWKQHDQQNFMNWQLTKLNKLLVPFWWEVAEEIANFRKQNQELYPEIMRSLAKWTSCEGIAVCKLIDYYELIEAPERRRLKTQETEFFAELQRSLQEQNEIPDLAATRT